MFFDNDVLVWMEVSMVEVNGECLITLNAEALSCVLSFELEGKDTHAHLHYFD